MPVQDDERERELVRLFNLQWDPAHQRSGIDAILEVNFAGRKAQIEFEVKSTTGDTVSTARDVGMEHIQKWRRKFFIIGFYTRDQKRPELKRCLCLSPTDMEPWIASIEKKILIDFKLAGLASQRLSINDLYSLCGEQENYSIEEAKQLHKQQWSREQYEAACDIGTGKSKRISPANMLELLQLRAKYISERGATLNNPHITKKHLDGFYGKKQEINTDWASQVKAIVLEFAAHHPGHPSLVAGSSVKRLV
jgi:hypothetical protein